MKRSAEVVDLFCGGGGTSTGCAQAAHETGVDIDLLAVNHWPIAVETHKRNHPWARHLCEAMDSINPRDAATPGKSKLLVASPECTHHSVARGGKPINEQSRATAWCVLRWADALGPESILIENVKEFRSWGPIGSNGRPLKSKAGLTFDAFIKGLESLGYRVDHRVMNAADYGGATTRERLFIQARRGRRPIRWPVATHASVDRAKQKDMFGDYKPWRPAREIIDWSIPGQSIFTRKKPLAAATLERIAAGLKKFGGKNAEPFLVILRNHQHSRSLNEPLPTVTTSGAHFALCEPFVIGQQSGATPRSIGSPLPTIATDGAISLVEPFIVEYRGNHAGREDGYGRVKPLGVPLPTQDTSNRFGLCEPFIVPQFSSASPKSVEQPLGTVTTTSRGVGLCEPFLVPFFGEREGQTPRTHSLDSPLPAVTGHGAGGLVEPFIMPVNHGKGDLRSYSMERPFPTVTSCDAWSMVEPFLVKYNGTGKANGIDEPIDTITAKDRFGLIECDGYYLDIRFRMLKWHELAAAMGFPSDYWFAGNREQKVKQIGNAVEVNVARALCRELLGGIRAEELAA